VPGTFRKHVAELGNAVGIDHEALLAAEGEARPDAGIFGQPGRDHARFIAWSMVDRVQIA
jgi:hypothetical protein